MDDTSPTSLDICTGLFEDFHEQGIAYCHWKSNEHLLEGLAGVTDLDVVVERHEDIEELLVQNGFQLFESGWFVRYPGLEDYLGYDPETGKLIHLHLHYRLAIGNKRLKDYHLPWIGTLLSRRKFDNDHGVYTADPAMEMLLLLVRYALKLQKRDYLKAPFGSYLDDDVVREYEWLRERIDQNEVVDLAAELLNDEAADLISKMLASPPGLWQFRKLRTVCADELSNYRTYGYVEAQVRGLLREMFLGFRSLNESYVGRPRFYRRTVPSGGVQIVLLGVDGAGKSTILEELDEWLSWKVDVQRIYYGSGDGPATRLRYPIIYARKRMGGPGTTQAGSESVEADGGGDVQSNRSLVMRVGRILRGLVLARERRKKLRTGWRARNRGLVVLGDRYPQKQIEGFIDGPLLAHLSESSSRLLRYLARWERDAYRYAEEHPPDLVIVLDVSPETAHERKPEMPIEQFARRKAAIDDLDFDTECRVVDAEQPLDEVSREIRELIWKKL